MTQTATDLLITMVRDLTVKVDLIHTQTIKTNGRVTKLEDFMVEQVKINSRMEGLYTASQEHTRLAIESITNREIDEFKKINKEELGIKIINTEYSGKIKLQIITGVISIISLIATAFIGFKIGENKINHPDLSNINNIINK